MKNKIISLIMCVICTLTLLTACNEPEEKDLPIAEANKNITKPKGSFFETNKKPAVEGGLVALGDNYLKLMVEGKEYKFETSEDVRRKICIFNKDENDLKIKRGTFLMLMYEIKDGNYYATDIEIVNAN